MTGLVLRVLIMRATRLALSCCAAGAGFHLQASRPKPRLIATSHKLAALNTSVLSVFASNCRALADSFSGNACGADSQVW